MSEKKRGRPASGAERVTMTISTDQWAVDWLQDNLPHTASVTSFARDAIHKEIARLQAEGAPAPPRAETEALVLRRIRSGERGNAVAKDLGLNIGTVHRWCRKAGVKLYKGKLRGQRTDETTHKLALELLRLGMPKAEIARQVKRSRQWLYALMADEGFKP